MYPTFVYFDIKENMKISYLRIPIIYRSGRAKWGTRPYEELYNPSK